MQQRMPPVGSNLDERIEDEAPPGKARVRHGGVARHDLPRADDVEIEHPVAPATAFAAAEGVLDGLEQREQCGQRHVGLGGDSGVGKASRPRPDGRSGNDP